MRPYYTEPSSYFEPGTTLYLYTIRTGKFTVHKGVVIEGKYGPGRPGWRKVSFSTKQAKEFCPKIEEIGNIQTGGPRLWLIERDDNKAARMFIDYEERKLFELEKHVAKKRALIKTLESVGMED